LAVTGWKPESAPLASGWHGAAKDDCVTVWFFGEKTNSTVSPGWAVTVFGLKASAPAPTVTWKLAADAEVAAAMATRVEARVKCIFEIFSSLLYCLWTCVGTDLARRD
jgi:hypothetical protein